MDINYIEEILKREFENEEKVVKKVIETSSYVFALFIDKRIDTQNRLNDERLSYIYNLSPLKINKKTKNYVFLEENDFFENYYDSNIFGDLNFFNESKEPTSYEGLLSIVSKRKHLNTDDIITFANIKGIDLRTLDIFSNNPMKEVEIIFLDRDNTTKNNYSRFFNDLKLKFSLKDDNHFLIIKDFK
ncbi:hypothetical protein KUL156_16840 [Alteromonas sp. KUL156]|nr:hypothetical protein KUL154_03080 [Alteromonas sp. KUL154]GFD99091.1 hypothetical protein KUL156_16840 [Alteromonas sp. KUL156]